MKTLCKAGASKYPGNMLKDLKESMNFMRKETEKIKKNEKELLELKKIYYLKRKVHWMN